MPASNASTAPTDRHSLTLPYPALPYSTLPYLTVPYADLLYATLPYPTVVCLTILPANLGDALGMKKVLLMVVKAGFPPDGTACNRTAVSHQIVVGGGRDWHGDVQTLEISTGRGVGDTFMFMRSLEF